MASSSGKRRTGNRSLLAAFGERVKKVASRPLLPIEKLGPEVVEMLEEWVTLTRDDREMSRKLGCKQIAGFLQEQGYQVTMHMARRWREVRYPQERFRN